MAGQDRRWNAPRALNNAVQCNLNVRIPSVCRIERVCRMMHRDNQGFVFRGIGYLRLKPLLLLTCASCIKRAVNIGIKADNGYKRGLKRPINVRLRHGRAVRAVVMAGGIAKIPHETE